MLIVTLYRIAGFRIKESDDDRRSKLGVWNAKRTATTSLRYTRF